MKFVKSSKQIKNVDFTDSPRLKGKTEANSPIKLHLNEDLVLLNQTHTDVISINSVNNSKDVSDDGKKAMEPIYSTLFELPMKMSPNRHQRSSRKSNIAASLTKQMNQELSYDRQRDLSFDTGNQQANTNDQNTSPSFPNIHRTAIKEIKLNNLKSSSSK